MSDFKFENVDDLVGMIRDEEVEPSFDHVEILGTPDFDYSELNSDRPVSWVGSGYVVAVPVENIDFTDGNMWNFEHAAGIYTRIKEGQIRYVHCPAARVMRITAADIKQSQEFEESGELEEQLRMVSPWEKSDLRDYHAYMLDGNHRALAAMAAGASYIYVHVAPNYREYVYKKDWAKA